MTNTIRRLFGREQRVSRADREYQDAKIEFTDARLSQQDARLDAQAEALRAHERDRRRFTPLQIVGGRRVSDP